MTCARCRRWELCILQQIVVGRESPADIAIGEDDCLSANHFALTWKPTGFEVEDLHSKNGTCFNGRRITLACLRLNNCFRAGHMRLLLEAGLSTMFGQLLQEAPAAMLV